MPPRRATPRSLTFSRELRHNQTDAEIKLWSRLRAHQLDGVHFRRQHAIDCFVVDFCAPTRKLIIELDGGQHAEQHQYDADRTAWLESQGYQVLRFWNHEVLGDVDAVIAAIVDALGCEDPPPAPPRC